MNDIGNIRNENDRIVSYPVDCRKSDSSRSDKKVMKRFNMTAIKAIMKK